MEDGDRIITIEAEQLLSSAMEKKRENYRLAQICCVQVGNQYELTYSYAKEYEILHYRITTDLATQIYSISDIYSYAYLYENEMEELYGVRIMHMNPDCHDKLYRIDQKTPFFEKEEK